MGGSKLFMCSEDIVQHLEQYVPYQYSIKQSPSVQQQSYSTDRSWSPKLGLPKTPKELRNQTYLSPQNPFKRKTKNPIIFNFWLISKKKLLKPASGMELTTVFVKDMQLQNIWNWPKTHTNHQIFRKGLASRFYPISMPDIGQLIIWILCRCFMRKLYFSLILTTNYFQEQIGKPKEISRVPPAANNNQPQALHAKPDNYWTDGRISLT